ncbi:DUF637 domain-containing protein [Paraburkholderia caledonica]|uniref:DUF637 domain-containing protein n=1 Tax=Paraburkholderia caledonica TaxID=134536 RepID=UPI001FC8CC4F|nr:DUF637 domain-containing protein [Paraburkholderia caledonica]
MSDVRHVADRSVSSPNCAIDRCCSSSKAPCLSYTHYARAKALAKTRQTAIGGGSFLTNLRNSAVSDVAAAGAYAIGNASLTSGSLVAAGTPGYWLAHAALGCAASAAEGTGCAGGAIGGAVSAFSANAIATAVTGGQGVTDPSQLAMITAATTLLGGGVAAALGQNAAGAVNAAANETLNNSCAHACGDDPEKVNEHTYTHQVLPQSGGAVDEEQAGQNLGVGKGTPLAGLPAATNSGVPSSLSGLANPSSIRFTQSSISSTFSDGSSLQDAIGALKSGVLSPSDLPPIRVYEQNGQIYTLDNRRLFVTSQAGTMVNITPATPQEITSQAWKFTTPNQGCIICIRGVPK